MREIIPTIISICPHRPIWKRHPFKAPTRIVTHARGTVERIGDAGQPSPGRIRKTPAAAVQILQGAEEPEVIVLITGRTQDRLTGARNPTAAFVRKPIRA